MERRRNKKGSILDVIVLAITLLGFSIAIIIMYAVSDAINTELQDSAALDNLIGGNRSRASMSQVNSLFPGIIDNSFLFLTMGLAIIALALAMMVRVHPVFVVFYIVMLGVIIFICGAFSNVYQEMANTPALTTVADNLIFTSHIMEYLPFIVGIIGFLIAIVMYKSYQTAQ